MSRYRELLPVARPEERIDLGEGGTPLVAVKRPGSCPPELRLWAKEEAGNPGGSFKARGLSIAVNRARELGATGIELPSAGNAAIALSMFAAAANMPARVAVPSDTPAAVLASCRRFGAETLQVDGTLVEAGECLRSEPSGYWDLSTLREPYRLEGKKTLGFELAEQFGWSLPEWIIYPTGGGTGLVGMHKAFDELSRLGLVGRKRPRFVSVQMAGCAPIVRAFEAGDEKAEVWEDPRTEVWGLRVPKAIGDFLILRALRDTDGEAVAVEELEVEGVQRRLALEQGLDWGPEGAACYAAVEKLARAGRLDPSDRVVLFQTGHPGNYR
jgi:threonine synthase